MEMEGFEPSALCLQNRRSTNWSYIPVADAQAFQPYATGRYTLAYLADRSWAPDGRDSVEASNLSQGSLALAGDHSLPLLSPGPLPLAAALEIALLRDRRGTSGRSLPLLTASRSNVADAECPELPHAVEARMTLGAQWSRPESNRRAPLCATSRPLLPQEKDQARCGQ